jgi:ABC-type branched-subunit amino acid transport system substrate-binding protein
MLEKTLTVDQMFPLFTINGAYTTFEEEFKGSLTPGKWADLVILSGNPLTAPVDDLPGITALMTMIGGEVVFCRDGYETLCGEEGSGTQVSIESEIEDTSNRTITVPVGSPIQIGVQGPVSGGMSNLHGPLENTVRLAIADFGLISEEYGFELINIDDQCDQNTAEAAAESLLSEHPGVVGVIGPLCSSGVLGARPVYDEISLISISGSNTREDLSQQFGAGGYNRTIFHDGQINASGVTLESIYELESVQEFYDRYENQYGPIPEEVKIYLPYTYDAASLLFNAIKETLTQDEGGNLVIDRNRLARAVRLIEIEGLTGSIKINDSGDRINHNE